MTADVLHLFLNPTAGRGRAGKREVQIRELLQRAGRKIRVHRSSAVGDLEAQVERAASEGIAEIVVAGGDGSIHEAVNGILRSGSDAALGVIPTGTGNDFAKACDIPLDWEQATDLLAARIQGGSLPRRIDAGRMNERYFANGAGIGFDAKVTRIARSIRIPLGDSVYLVAVMRALVDGVATPRLSVRGDGVDWNGPATLISISNGAWIGGLFHIAPPASNADGRLDLLIADPVSRRRILQLLPKLMRGEHLDEAEISHRLCRRVVVTAADPLPSHLDGEVQPLQSAFELEVLPEALSLL